MNQELAKEIKIRTTALIGEEGLSKLEQSRVAVCGLGGVGSYVVEALARAGIGHLTLVDFDRISLSNINRQIPALLNTVGEYKTDCLSSRIKRINPDCQIIIKNEFIAENNIETIIKDCDYIVDAIDFVPGKVGLIHYATERKIPIVSCMGTGNKLCPELIEIADISKTSACPLARAVRKELRKYGITKGIRVVYSKEEPKSKQQLQEKSKVVPASISYLPGAAGLFLASVVIRDLIGYPIK
ncbi:MAG: tRNA threonylcarbamoyladenosine dehydratase [Bacillota bacterium]|jgi:tRNA A37 threonylcarbamoyladenosine dehydratase